MKKILTVLLAVVMVFSLVACGETSSSTNTPNDNLFATKEQDKAVSNDNSSNEPANTSDQIKASPDKYTWYVKNYVGKNCATLGYTSLGGDRMDKYGAGILELIFVCSDGTYVDISSDDALKEYTVIGQSLPPNTELKYVFDKDSEGAYFASTVRLFRFSGLPVRFKRSEIIGEAAKLESQYFRCPGLQQPKPLQAGIHPI